ncbi:MAG: hypothetical protein JO264_13900 [Acidisphaera sp.]|nr:hypothetical protein [Acidisphaera sp.]
MTIVTSTHRYKRPPRRRDKQPEPIAAIVTAATPKRRAATTTATAAPSIAGPVIVEPKRARTTRFGPVPEMTAEDHRRRGDAAAALFRELVRRAREE